jgi:hypothetical protein
MTCAGWSFIFSIFCSNYHEAFSLLMAIPVLLWLGYYLNEIFRNPVLPKPLSVTLDAMIFLAFAFGIMTLVLTFQIVPPDLKLPFFLMCALLPLLAIIVMLLKDITISRALPLYVLPGALIFCVLLRLTYQPLFEMNPDRAFSSFITRQVRYSPDLQILSWAQNEKTPSYVRFVLPLNIAVTPLNQMDMLESAIQTRRGPVDIIIPESQFYNLPPSVREEGYVLKTAWQWRSPLSLWTLLAALQNETLDFKALAEPVFLLEVPVEQE